MSNELTIDNPAVQAAIKAAYGYYSARSKQKNQRVLNAIVAFLEEIKRTEWKDCGGGQYPTAAGIIADKALRGEYSVKEEENGN